MSNFAKDAKLHHCLTKETRTTNDKEADLRMIEMDGRESVQVTCFVIVDCKRQIDERDDWI